ncbi:MAG: DUF167 family protein [Caulobacteraceae bacterium]
MAGARLVVRLTPRADRDRIDGWGADADGRPVLKARTTAAPADGKANAALIRLVADALGLPPSAVRLASGASSRVKTLRIDGVDEEGLRSRLGAPI